MSRSAPPASDWFSRSFWPNQAPFTLTKFLQVDYPSLISSIFYLYLNAFLSQAPSAKLSPCLPESGEVRLMINLNLNVLSLIPVSLAVAFMIWAFWHFCKASGRRQ